VAVYSSFLTSSRDKQAGNCNHQIGLFSIVEKRRFTVGIVGIYLFSVGLLSGMIFDRIRFDESRTVLLKELEGTSLGYTSKQVDLVTIHS
jgi:hypothetical protein